MLSSPFGCCGRCRFHRCIAADRHRADRGLGQDGNARAGRASHVDTKTIRGIAMQATAGLARGTLVRATGLPIAVPRGREGARTAARCARHFARCRRPWTTISKNPVGSSAAACFVRHARQHRGLTERLSDINDRIHRNRVLPVPAANGYWTPPGKICGRRSFAGCYLESRRLAVGATGRPSFVRRAFPSVCFVDFAGRLRVFLQHRPASIR